MIDESKVTNVHKLAKILDTPETTIRRWLKEGHIAGIQVNKKWLIPISEVERLTNPEKFKK